ncbi:MAG TPA: molybdenum ABC transporter ATP-binding protein [Myxococcota bacterium]
MTGGLEAELSLALGAFRLDVALAREGPGVTAVFGPSGAGKSTLLRCLAGLEPAARGRIVVDGETWLDSARGRVLPAHRRRVGLVFQDGGLFRHLSVRGNLAYARRRARGPAPALEEVASQLGVSALLDRHPAGLSGGERQRVAIARALLAAPRLLLLDEPLAALDAPARGEILELLRTLLQETPIPTLYVTHSRGEALQLADRVVLLEGGRVRGAGPVRELALRPELGGEEQVGALLEAEVVAVDAAHELSTLAFPGGLLVVPGRFAPGARRRLEVLARDVSLALDPPRRTSILNVLPARVLEVRGADTPRPLVLLAVGERGETRLLARVSRRSLEQLGIAPGLPVYAQVKAVAVVA